eukprot:6250135-Lingulodinium_polyedra.AAC.1
MQARRPRRRQRGPQPLPAGAQRGRAEQRRGARGAALQEGPPVEGCQGSARQAPVRAMAAAGALASAGRRGHAGALGPGKGHARGPEGPVLVRAGRQGRGRL